MFPIVTSPESTPVPDTTPVTESVDIPDTVGVAVIGGGVIGCSVAHALAHEGLDVAVFERGRVGREATWAAGGMLSPLGEELEPGPFQELGLDSLALYPTYLERIRTDSGVDVALIRSGKALLAFDDRRRDVLAERQRRLARAGHPARWLDGATVRSMAPALSDHVRGALHLPDEGQVENRLLGAAAAAAARMCGVRVIEGAMVGRVDVADGRAEGIALEDGTRVRADVVVVAAGAWSGRLAGLPSPLPVRPVRGQMISLDAGGAAPGVILESEDAYLIPRPDGTVVVGSTMEEVGFDASNTAEALEGLHRAAAAILPSLGEAEIGEAWAGLRPAMPDGLPVIGADPEVDGLVYATGHFRNGILLAPATAFLVAGLVTGTGGADLNLRPFRPGRFADVSLVR